MNLTRILLLPLFLSGCAHGLLGGLSAVDTSGIAGTPSKYSAHDAHPPAPRTPYDTQFMVGGKVYTYEMLGFENARDYDRAHDRRDPSAPSFSADEYKSGAYRYAKSGERGSVSWRISQYKHRGERRK